MPVSHRLNWWLENNSKLSRNKQVMKLRRNRRRRLRRLLIRRKLPKTRLLKKKQLPQLMPRSRPQLMLRSQKLNQHQRNKNRHQLQHLLPQLNSQSQPSQKLRLPLQLLPQRKRKPQNNRRLKLWSKWKQAQAKRINLKMCSKFTKTEMTLSHLLISMMTKKLMNRLCLSHQRPVAVEISQMTWLMSNKMLMLSISDWNDHSLPCCTRSDILFIIAKTYLS